MVSMSAGPAMITPHSTAQPAHPTPTHQQASSGNRPDGQPMRSVQETHQTATSSTAASRATAAASEAPANAVGAQQRQQEQQQYKGLAPYLYDPADGHREGPALKRPRYDVAPAADGYPSEDQMQQQQQQAAFKADVRQVQQKSVPGGGNQHAPTKNQQQQPQPPGLPQFDSGRASHLAAGEVPAGLYQQGSGAQQQAGTHNQEHQPKQQRQQEVPNPSSMDAPQALPAGAGGPSTAVQEQRHPSHGGAEGVQWLGPDTNPPQHQPLQQQQQQQQRGKEAFNAAAAAGAGAATWTKRAQPLTSTLLPSAPSVSGTAGVSGSTPRGASSSSAAAAANGSHPSAAAAVHGSRPEAASQGPEDSDEVQQPSPPWQQQQHGERQEGREEAGLQQSPARAAAAGRARTPLLPLPSSRFASRELLEAAAAATAGAEAAIRGVEQGAAAAGGHELEANPQGGPERHPPLLHSHQHQQQRQQEQLMVPAVDLAGPEPVVEDNQGGGQRPPAAYHSRQRVVQAWLQLWGVTPATLPGDLQQRLRDWLGVIPFGLVVYLSPPGVLVSLQLLLDRT